jgi:hypothetical protein
MNRSPSSLWLSPPKHPGAEIEQALEDGLRCVGPGPVFIYFRADDIGVPGDEFARMMTIFSEYRTPLSLAVVPAWLTRARWRSIRNRVDRLEAQSLIGDPHIRDSIWCWHQHGWRHQNHEPRGKKQEFGPSRDAAEIERDLRRGRERLRSMMGADFYPAFTPPWNRCGPDTLNLLREMEYRAVSRSRGAPPSPPGLPDFSVSVDLHTRKEADPKQGWEFLMAELKTAVAGGFCGLMIHHQRMNPAACDFLENLLSILSRFKELRPVHLRDLAESGVTPR